jgi:hypothetical protein
MALSLATRKNIRDNTPKMEEHLAMIEVRDFFRCRPINNS